MQSERGLLDKVSGWGGGFGGLLFMIFVGAPAVLAVVVPFLWIFTLFI